MEEHVRTHLAQSSYKCVEKVCKNFQMPLSGMHHVPYLQEFCQATHERDA